MGQCSKSRANIKVPKLGLFYEFWHMCDMSSEQKKKLLKAKVALAPQNELGRVPKEEEIERADNSACPRHVQGCFGAALQAAGTEEVRTELAIF